MDAEQFIIIWQAASSLDEVVERTGLRRNSAAVRATRLRQQGVPLQKFTQHNGKRIDYARLAQIARDARPESE